MLMQLSATVKRIRRVSILLLPPYDRGRVSDVSVCVTMTSLITRASLITWRRQEICIDRSRGGKVRNIDHRSIQSRVREREKEREEKIKTEETWGITENRERLNQNLPISVSLMTNLVLTNFLEWVHCILSCCPSQYKKIMWIILWKSFQCSAFFFYSPLRITILLFYNYHLYIYLFIILAVSASVSIVKSDKILR